MSTFVVKADVHMSEDSIIRSSCRATSNNGTYSMKKKGKPSVKFPSEDDITVIETENINVSGNQQDKYGQQQCNKRPWSLRIKLQTYENQDSLPDGDSDEEIFSVKSRTKANTERSRRSEICKPANIQAKSKRGVKNGLNGYVKVMSKENEKMKNLEKTIVSSNSDNIKTELKASNNVVKIKNDKSVLSKSDKDRSFLLHEKNVKQKDDVNSKNTNKMGPNYKDCVNINNNVSKRKSNERLAPLFTKRLKPNPETVAARRLFLQPNVIENDCKNMDKRVHVSGALPFPIISHVTQLQNTCIHRSIDYKIPTKTNQQYTPLLDVTNYKYIMDFTKTNSQQLKNIEKTNIQEALSEIEEWCSDARKMWDVVTHTSKGQPKKKSPTKIRGKRGKLFEKKEAAEQNNNVNQSEHAVWTDKYKPMSTQDIVGNEEAAGKLKEWLSRWRVSLTSKGNSSADEFYSSDCSYSSSNENNQVAVLLGPHGSGKSASVYAVAEELGYTILEVNASSRRTGKKLLKELEEATKSHRIKKDKGVDAFFKGSVPDKSVSKKIPQNSLIFLEDIDLIFEEDEGLISATYQLALNTKRPIVMTCKDICPHLNKMAPQQNRIYFQSAIGCRVSALLQLISLAETGYKLSSGCIAALLEGGDLRRALLQLQYLLLSGPYQALEHGKPPLWQHVRCHVYKTAIKANKKLKSKKNANRNPRNDDSINILNDIANKLDNVALVSSLIQVEDPALNWSHVKIQPSLSLIEDTSPYSVSQSINSDIAEWISKRVIYNEQLNEQNKACKQNNIILKMQLNRGIDSALSSSTSFLLDHRTMSVDYLPSVRAICRAEECRANINSKRGNRFFHYLHSLKVPATSLKPNILTAVCRVFEDKASNNVPTDEYNTDYT